LQTKPSGRCVTSVNDSAFRNAFDRVQARISFILKGMKTIRIVLGVLSIIPLTLIIDNAFLHPNNYADDSLYLMAYYVFGIPILMFNYWAWFEPIIIERLFFMKE
jgi:hypothetical protein